MLTPGCSAETPADRRVAAVRRFNRFYTQRIGVLQDGYLDSGFSLAEVRVLFELAARGAATATDLARDLDLDPGYLSRIVRRFRRRGLVAAEPVPGDGRQRSLSLTACGAEAFAPLDARSRDGIRALIAPIADGEQERLVAAMQIIERAFGGGDAQPAPIVIRSHRRGDLGWIVHRHGALYAEEYGYDEDFEGLVAEVAAAFLRQRDPAREHCWVAEQDGALVGSIMLAQDGCDLAKLRLFLVEPAGRGRGVGGQLIAECVAFARAAGYRAIRLWTHSELVAARRLYQKAGFQLVDQSAQHRFGRDLVSETWELAL